MKKELGKEYGLKDRKNFLESNADAIESIGYMKPFDPEEIQQAKEILADESIAAAAINEQLAELKKEYAEKLKPINAEIARVLKCIKEGAEFVNEECYKIIDHEEGLTGYYNSFGDLVSCRAIRPEERQKTIFQLPKFV